MPRGTGNNAYDTKGALASIANSVPLPPRAGQIELLTNEVNNEVNTLHELLYALEQRLAPAIPQLPKPECAGGPQEVGPTLAPIALQLDSALRGVRFAQTRVRELLDTLEL
jgi:hypothetical protein